MDGGRDKGRTKEGRKEGRKQRRKGKKEEGSGGGRRKEGREGGKERGREGRKEGGRKKEAWANNGSVERKPEALKHLSSTLPTPQSLLLPLMATLPGSQRTRGLVEAGFRGQPPGAQDRVEGNSVEASGEYTAPMFPGSVRPLRNPWGKNTR